MFERYTEKARRAILFARYEASQFGSPFIESEFVLLGLMREDKMLAYRFFPSGEAIDSIRQQIDARTTFREKVSTSVDLKFSEECKRVLVYAAEEAEKLSHKHIGTEHLLLGLLRQQDCFAGQLLKDAGISLESVRQGILSLASGLIYSPSSLGTAVGYATTKLLYNPASETIVVEMRGLNSFLQPARLFMRHKDADAYERIGDPSELISYESPVTCEKHPIVLFNSHEHKRDGTGPNWASLCSFDLSTKSFAICVAKGQLSIAESHLRAWIKELISLSDDTQTLFLNVAIEQEVRAGAIVHYHLASLHLPNNRLQLLSPLKNIRL